mmetsp:Transcript_592/g.535  ORF Transcript_592/g.535 Transcript_592/m.535 type:complete len:107 (-) Transcript_592:160-480(-)
MNKLLLVVMFLAFIGRLTAFSCDFGRFGCIPSCMFQNCATGYCEKGICTCDRCAKGSAVKGSVGISIGGGGAAPPVPVDGGFLAFYEGGEGAEGEEGFEGEEGGEQ